MSSKATGTREALLDAYSALLEKGRGGEIRLSDIAAEAGVSRQAIYLHFADKAALLLALVERAKEAHRFDEVIAAVRRAPDAEAAISQWLSLHIEFTPRIMRLSRAIEQEQEGDEALRAAWHARRNNRRAHTRELAERVHAEGRLAPGVSVDEAADLLWALTTPSFTEDLLVRCRWSKDRLFTHLNTMVQTTVLQPHSNPKKGKTK